MIIPLSSVEMTPGGGGGTSSIEGQGMIFTVINIGTGYPNRPNWLLAGYSVYHRVASQGFPAGFPAHNIYDRPAISSPATTTVRAGRPLVYDRPAAAISAPSAVRAGRPAGRNRFRVFHFFLLQNNNRTGSIRGVQYCNRVCIWKFLVRYIVTGCIFCAPSGLWQGQVLNPPAAPPTHLRGECPPPPPREMTDKFSSLTRNFTFVTYFLLPKFGSIHWTVCSCSDYWNVSLSHLSKNIFWCKNRF